MGKIYIAIVLFFFLFSKLLHADIFKIDLVGSSSSMNKNYEKFELLFDFKENIVKQIVKPKNPKYVHEFSDVARIWKISEIKNNSITFEQSFKENYEFMHKTYMDDVYLYGSKDFKFKKKVMNGGGIDAPAVQVKFDTENLNIIETFSPFSKSPKVKKYSFKENKKSFLTQENVDTAIKIALFAATVYLIINNLDEINDIKQKSIKKVNNNKLPKSVSPGAMDPTSVTINRNLRLRRTCASPNYGCSTILNSFKSGSIITRIIR